MSRQITYNGVTYNNLKELCGEYGVNYPAFMARLKRGLPIEACLSRVRLKPQCVCGVREGNPVDFNGKTYPSLKSLATECGISYNRLLYRLKRGIPMNDAVKPGVRVKRSGRAITCHGETFDSIRAFAKSIEVKECCVRMLIKSGKTADEIFDNRERYRNGVNSVIVNGVTYPSLAACAHAHGLKYCTVRRRIAAGRSLEDAFAPVR